MRHAIALLLVPLAAAPLRAIFADVPAPRIIEIPVERLLENLGRSAGRLPAADRQRAIGRVHLLAYLRGVVTLPVLRDHPDQVAEGPIGDCGPLDPLTPKERAQLDALMKSGRAWHAVQPPTGERCLTPSYNLHPRNEIPPEAGAGQPASTQHLAAARSAYEAALGLDPSNLRTRLALAFIYDRVGASLGGPNMNLQAAEHLRVILREGLKRIPRPPDGAAADWETHVVVSEALAHFIQLSTSRVDRRLRSEVANRLRDNPPSMSITPILLPIGPDTSVEALIERTSNVSFDFSGQGMPMRAGWITDKAAWLVWDPNHRGRIVGGFQLFGSVTWMAFWSNGYQALAMLDDDNDGLIRGRELMGLALWHDRDQNGVSEAHEVESAASHGIVSLAYDHERVSDELWVSRHGATWSNGRTAPTYDWIVRGRSSRPTQ